MSDDDKWMPLDEAIARVMKVEKCSRKAAIKKIAKAAKEKKLTTKAMPAEQPPMNLITSTEEVENRLQEDPSSMFVRMDDFITRSDFTAQELMGELKSGRLRASGSDVTMFKMQMGELPHPAEFIIDCQALINWMINPKTPPHLLEKFNKNLGRKPQ